VYGLELETLEVLVDDVYHFTSLLVVAEIDTVPVPHLEPFTPVGAAGLFTMI
jgi:hypothetical protein